MGETAYKPEVTRISGGNLLDAVNKFDTKQIIAPVDSLVSIGCFSTTSHMCQVDASDNYTLVSSTDSDGFFECELNDKRDEARVRSGDLTFVPAGINQVYDFHGRTKAKIVLLNKRLFDEVDQMDCGLPSSGMLEPRLEWIRPSIQRLINAQYQAMISGQSNCRIMAETNAMKLASELLRTFGNDNRIAGSASFLSSAEMGQIIEFIDMKINRNFGLEELARLTKRDKFNFIRAFKLTTGETPHQFVIDRRLDKAKQKLASSNAPLATIAYDCGFSSQAHMTSTFTKHIGASPGAYRRDRRG